MENDTNVNPIVYLQMLVLLVVLVVPFVYNPFSSIPFELPKVLFLQWSGLFLSILSWCCVLFSKIKLKRFSWKLVLLWSLFFLSLSFSSFLAGDWSKSLWGNFYRQDGLITAISLMLWAMLIHQIFSISFLKKLFLSLFIGQVFVSLIALGEFYWGSFASFSSGFWDGYAVGATFGQPNFLGGYLAVLSPIGWYLISKTSWKFKPIFVFGQLIILSGIYVTDSLGAGITFLMGGILVLFNLANKKLKLILLAILLFSFVALIFLYFQTQTKDVYPDSRIRIFRQLGVSVTYKPVFGWGVANVDQAFKSNSWPIVFQHDIYVDKAHSHFLEILVTGGLVGISFYLLFLSGVGSKLWQISQNNYLYLILFNIFILFLFHSQTNVISIGQEWLFWLIVGSVLAKNPYDPNTSDSNNKSFKS